MIIEHLVVLKCHLNGLDCSEIVNFSSPPSIQILFMTSFCLKSISCFNGQHYIASLHRKWNNKCLASEKLYQLLPKHSPWNNFARKSHLQRAILVDQGSGINITLFISTSFFNTKPRFNAKCIDIKETIN